MDNANSPQPPNRVLVIKGSEWLRGRGCGALLWTDNTIPESVGKYCCLGLDGKARGIPDKRLSGAGFPNQCYYKVRADFDCKLASKEELSVAERFSVDWQASATTVGGINDVSDPMTDETRIERLRPYFLTRGVGLDWRPNE